MRARIDAWWPLLERGEIEAIVMTASGCGVTVREYGDYLADDPYSEWAYAERERLRDLATIPLRALVELRSDDPEVALGYMQRLAEMEPFDNEIQRQLLVMLVKQGRRSRAVRLYQAFEIRLLRAFNEKPTFGLSDIVSPRTNGPLMDALGPGA